MKIHCCKETIFYLKSNYCSLAIFLGCMIQSRGGKGPAGNNITAKYPANKESQYNKSIALNNIIRWRIRTFYTTSTSVVVLFYGRVHGFSFPWQGWDNRNHLNVFVIIIVINIIIMMMDITTCFFVNGSRDFQMYICNNVFVIKVSLLYLAELNKFSLLSESIV